MFKTTTALLFITLIVTAVAAEDQQCKSPADVDLAWKANRHDDALACLNTLMRADPADPKLHMLMGEYCLNQGNLFCAKEQFNIKSVRNNFAVEIAELYKKEADYLYSEAALLDPSVRVGIVKKSFQDNKRALGLYHLEEAKKWAKKPGFDIVVGEHRNFARKYLGDAEVKKELPDVIILKPRRSPYEFLLKKGEQTGSWIACDEKTTTHMHIYEVENNKFEIRYKNGDTVNVWEGERVPKKPRDWFKIVATEDTTVLIQVD